MSVISFPLLLDRDVGLTVAVLTSLRAVRENPVTMAIWGLIIAAVLAIGFLPLFVGLAVAVPILAHARVASVPKGRGTGHPCLTPAEE